MELSLSLRDLEAASGIGRGDLSKMERGRLFPTTDEFDKVMAALEAAGGAPAPADVSPSSAGAEDPQSSGSAVG